jgi:hypothetical protein
MGNSQVHTDGETRHIADVSGGGCIAPPLPTETTGSLSPSTHPESLATTVVSSAFSSTERQISISTNMAFLVALANLAVFTVCFARSF